VARGANSGRFQPASRVQRQMLAHGLAESIPTDSEGAES
jgi:hypothetical protein